ncbi:CapA family protein [Oribacterium sp. WCC10]|uniref:CapA family protein n=1 Tax=Oribacterium sp. WCC10 TaxID=1855343 RepID=UPI0008E4CACF|nr:CapA family protein [Oribacterium sp. WCC10]SFG06691.1 capsule synthesis protein PGA_cap [Oribacterium sp. WCC10]
MREREHRYNSKSQYKGPRANRNSGSRDKSEGKPESRSELDIPGGQIKTQRSRRNVRRVAESRPDKAKSVQRGGHSGRNIIEDRPIRRKKAVNDTEKEILRMRDLEQAYRWLDQQTEPEEPGQGRHIKVESVGKVLGPGPGRVSCSGNAYRTLENKERADYGKSRKRAGKRKGDKKSDGLNGSIKGSGERIPGIKKFKHKAAEHVELSDDMIRLPGEKEDSAEDISGKGVNLIYGDDLTGNNDRKKILFNTRQSNYSGVRSERMMESQKRREIENQFQDVHPYIRDEDESDNRDSRRSHRWGKLLICIFAFLFIYEIVLLGAFSMVPDLKGNVKEKAVMAKENFLGKFQSEKMIPETETPEEPAETETVAESMGEETAVSDVYVNESGAMAVQNPTIPIDVKAIGTGDSEPVELLFAGDIYLSDHVMDAYHSTGDISGVLSDNYLQEIASVDYFMANEEFPFSTGGKQAEDKQFTFRVDPKYVSIFKDIGIDLVTLANNHTLDYGTEALADTISTLDDAGIRHVGAGENLKDARETVTVSIKGKKIAFIGATRVIPEANWAAGESSAGVFSTYDDANLIADIKAAKEQADFVVVYVHWGEERKESPNEVQKTLAHSIVDAGADLVIGAHPHVLQGTEYYKGVPIVYSLGNFIFGSSIPKTALLKVTIEDAEDPEDEAETPAMINSDAGNVSDAVSDNAIGSSGSNEVKPSEKSRECVVKLQLIPGKSGAGYTQTLDADSDKADFYSYYAGISSGISVDSEGVISKR